MDTNARYKSWMAEQVAKSYLYETRLLDIYQNDADQFDFVCTMKEDVSKIFAVEVKSSLYTKSEIIRKYQKIRETYSKINLPILMLYINYLDKTGYFEFIAKGIKEDIITLNTSNLKTAISSINFALARPN